jgi:hypothetical protein
VIRGLTEAELAPVVIAEAVPPFTGPGKRCPVLMHVKRVGEVFFVEQLDVRGDWKVIATSKPDKKTPLAKAQLDAVAWMIEAHDKVLEMTLSTSGHRAG